MTKEQATVGVRVRANREFSGVPAGTEGVIDEDYGTGVMVAWDGPPGHSTLPSRYRAYDGVAMVVSNILRDGFNEKDELQFLDVV